MSDMRETKSTLVKIDGELIPTHRQLVKVNRLLLAVIASLMSLIMIAGAWLLPNDDFIADYKLSTVSQAYSEGMNPALSAEVNTLKGQVVGLVSGSIESKLRTLESSIRVGSVANSLGTIEELKNDLKILRSYSEPEKTQPATISNEKLMQEMSQLKRLIYTTIASCGLMLAAVAGIWIKNRKRIPHIKTGFLGKR
jgi:hypothetical protein